VSLGLAARFERPRPYNPPTLTTPDSPDTNALTPSREDAASNAEAGVRTSDPDYLETFARGLQVMLAMGDGGGSISDLARLTGLPRPTVRRVLYTLTKLGYARGDARSFTLTPKVTRFATAFMGTAGQSRMLQTFCETLAAELGEIVTVAILDGDEQLHLAFGVPPNFVGIALGVGSRLPSYLTAAGRLIWSYRPDSEIDDFLQRIQPVARTSNSLTDKTLIRAAILDARTKGFCIADGEYSAEFKGVAYPVVTAGSRLFGALTINARKGHMMTDDRFDTLVARCGVEAVELGHMISQ
jgi:IclR family pca regulon transcriptional regulator